MRILLIDDESSIRRSLASVLRSEGHEVHVATDGNDGMSALRSRSFDLMLSDIQMPGPDGFTLLQFARRTRRATDVVLMTAHGEIRDALAAIEHSASDYLVKPFSADTLVRRVRQIEQRQTLNSALAESRAGPPSHGLVGGSAAMAHIRQQIDAIAPTEATVLLTGESGTGKELVARALHAASPRRDGPFVAINCASFPLELLEAELFGHTRGAFTSAERARSGRLAIAQGGTLFLDEVSELPRPSQAKLLRVIEQRVYTPLGSNRSVALDVRLCSATNRSLPSLVERRAFREDLYYRLKVMTVSLPPLRERIGDLAELAAHFLRSDHGSVLEVSDKAFALLEGYSFPGNVRELAHALEHAAILARAGGTKMLRIEHLPAEIRDSRKEHHPIAATPGLRPLREALLAYERRYLLRALAQAKGNRTSAAAVLGISRKNLWEKLRNHGIANDEIEPSEG